MFFRFLTYNKFKPHKWKRLSPEKRAKVFQKLENIQAKKQHRDVCKVFFKDLGDVNGYHRGATNTIDLHTKYIYEDKMRYLGMATLFHEGRHAFQHHAINNEKFGPFSKARRWKKNFEGYTSTDDGKYSFYSMQPVERDANHYALKRLKRFRFRYRKDPLFAATLKQKEEDFVYVKEKAKKELGLFYRLRVALKNRKNRKERD